MKIAVCDYGAGNVRSVELAFTRLGGQLVDDVAGADLAVLPGVGSARSAMAELRRGGLDEALRARVREGRPVLGICLGLQLALEESEEDGGVRGLGLVPGRAVRLRDGRVPRIGWAAVAKSNLTSVRLRSSPDDRNQVETWLPDGEAFWFAHSYAAESPATVATSEGVAAIVEHGSFTGVQFHPEKSGAAGARFLERCLSRA